MKNCFGPVLIVKGCCKQKNGSYLINASIRKGMGYTSIFLVGDPVYYYRVSIRPSVDSGIKNKKSIPEASVMNCELDPDGLKGISCTIKLKFFNYRI